MYLLFLLKSDYDRIEMMIDKKYILEVEVLKSDYDRIEILKQIRQ